jgi:hypothetical protein
MAKDEDVMIATSVMAIKTIVVKPFFLGESLSLM